MWCPMLHAVLCVLMMLSLYIMHIVEYVTCVINILG